MAAEMGFFAGRMSAKVMMISACFVVGVMVSAMGVSALSCECADCMNACETPGIISPGSSTAGFDSALDCGCEECIRTCANAPATPAPLQSSAAAAADDHACIPRVSFVNDAWADNLVINCNSTTTAATVSADLENYDGKFSFLPETEEEFPILWRCKLHAYVLPGCITFNAWANARNQDQLLSPCSFCGYKANHNGLFINTVSCAPSGEANWEKIADWGNCYHS